MSRVLVLVSVVLGVGGLVAISSPARADEMDVTLSRLRTDEGGGLFAPDDDAFARLMSQYGAAIAPPVLSPARTTGYGGFYIGLEGWLSGIDSDEDYWQLGTEGDSRVIDEGRNRFVDSTLIGSRLAVRKGFPFGFELGGSLGHMLNSSVWTWGLEVKWAIFEGYRTGIGILPDLAVRGMVHTTSGQSQFSLTVPSLDVTLSKPIVFLRSGSITPFVAWQLLWIFADSELVDLTPERDAFAACAPEPGPPTVMDAEAGQKGVVICNGDAGDYNNNGVFTKVRTTRQRLAFGFQGRIRAFTLSASFAFDLQKPGEADDDAPSDLPRQWTVATAVGLTF